MNQSDNKRSISNAKKDSKYTIYISDIWKSVKKFWVICLVLAVAIGGYKFYTGYKNHVPLYSSSATFTISTQDNSTAINGISAYSFYYDSATVAQLTKTFPYIMKSNLLSDAICDDLQLDYMPASLSASPVEGANMFTLTATGRDPQLTYDTLMSAIDNYPSVAKYVIGNIRLDMITSPYVASNPSNNNDYMDDAVQGVLIGAILGAVWIFFYAVQRKTIRTKKEISAMLNCEALGIVPLISFKKRSGFVDKSVLITNSAIDPEFVGTMRVVRNVLRHSLKNGEKIIATTSTAPGEGKTTVGVNLALSLGESGKNILIVDADIRHPSVAQILGVDIDKLTYTVQTDKYSIAYLDEYKVSLLVFNGDKKSQQKYINTKEIKSLFNEVKDSYDYIFVDTPPCGLVSDALYVAGAADAVLYVIRQDTVRVSRIRSALDSLMGANANVVGCVLNGAASGFVGYGYGYGYGKYGYGYGKYGYGYGKYGYGEKSSRGSRKERG